MTTKYMVHLKPNDNLDQKIRGLISLDRSIEKMPLYYPHSTLMIGVFPEKEEEIIRALETVAPRPEFDLRINSIELFDDNCIVAKLEDKEEVIKLHYDVTKSLLRHLVFDNFVNIPEQFAEDQQRLIALYEYGSVYSGPFYSPHITLGNYNSETNVSNFKDLIGEKMFVDGFHLSKKIYDGKEKYFFPVKKFLFNKVPS